MKFSEKEIRIFKGISLVSGVFTFVIAITMIFSLIQLKTINPLDSPSLQSIKEQFDRDPDNRDKAEQVRAIDLMARKAYFSSRWQVETGSYLLLAGAFVFVVFQRLVAGSEKPPRSLHPGKPDIDSERIRNRRYLVISAGAVTIIAVVSSFVLRTELPAPGRSSAITETTEPPVVLAGIDQPGDVNYPFFRGEGSRGIAGGAGFPTEWNGTEGRNIKWKIAVPKPGQNSPVIWGEKLFITGAVNGECEVYCINKNTGEILWTGSASGFPGASSAVPESDADAGMAVSTAAVSENEVCAIFGNGNIVCFDHDGELKWAKNIGVPESTYGYSSSLVIYDKLLLVQYDSQDKITLSGFELNTGEVKWETIRSGRPVNSSPVLATFNGQPQLLINGNPNVSSYDPVDGKELWSLPGVSGDVAPSLAVNSEMVYTATDYYKIIALKPGRNGSKVWEDNTFTPDVSSPVANDGYLFVVTGNGDAACYNSETGDTLWSHYFENPFYASPVIGDNKVWMLDRSGTMHIVEAGSILKIISSSPIGEKSDCTPAFSEKKIYIRGRSNLYCIE
ncbi:MAG TPA: PQQ-binding-like beta-propeller repeat protein, partial [Bacteroidales bacterium]|nr:PQQ-binding-like beta-propeller repeat protein [Bacteroidales bacterium]